MREGHYGKIDLRNEPLREAALLAHESKKQKIDYLQSILPLGNALKEPGDLLRGLQDLYFPSDSKELSNLQKAEYIRSFKDVDWSEVFTAPKSHKEDAEEYRKRQGDHLLKHYE